MLAHMGLRNMAYQVINIANKHKLKLSTAKTISMKIFDNNFQTVKNLLDNKWIHKLSTSDTLREATEVIWK
jgi:S-adenosylhomocysteine hydrolase